MSRPSRSAASLGFTLNPATFRSLRVATIVACLCGAFSTAPEAQTVPAIQLTELASGFVTPVSIANAGDGTGRLFIVEKGGTVYIWDGNQLLPQPFLRLPVSTSANERGLLGLAFHPQYGTNGFFYVHYSNPINSVEALDDFQDGTLQNWRVGSAASPLQPRLEPDQGPNGAGDSMMRIESNGSIGAGGRLVVINTDQWSGNYTAEGITQISMDVRNISGNSEITVRLGMLGASGTGNDGIASVQSHLLVADANSPWVPITFDIDPANFAGTATADPVQILQTVSQLRIFHNTVAEVRGEPILATIGIDNVRATRNKNGPEGSTVLSRFQVSSDSNVADPASEVVLLTQEQPFGNHNGGQIGFSPLDGYLYVALGDGGSGGDPLNNGQNLGTMLGTVLRIDVPADPSDPNPAISIPLDNPFVNTAGARPEIWAYGLRNPWRFSFDRTTGDLFIADVGQNAIEELNFQIAGSPGGENYGWRLMEGSSCFNPLNNCDDGTLTLTLPVIEYDHSQGCSITGGYRYRGRLYPSLGGIFFYSDFCSGTIWAATEDATGAWSSQVALSPGINVSSFGEDEDGEIYVLNYGAGTLNRLDLAAPPPKIATPVAATILVAGGEVNATGTGQNLSWLVTRQPDGLAVATGNGPNFTFTVPADSTSLQQIRVVLSGDGVSDQIDYNIAPATVIVNPVAGTTLVPAATVNANGTGQNLTWQVTRQPDGLVLSTGTTGPNVSFVVPADSTAQQQIVVALTGDGGVVQNTYNIVPNTQIVAPSLGTVLVAGSNITATGAGQNLSWQVTRQPGDLAIPTVGNGATVTFTVPADSTAQQQIVIVLTGDGGIVQNQYAIQAAAPPLQAVSSATPSTGVAALAVQFTGSGVGGTGVYTFAWSFGDQQNSDEQNPAHTYNLPGTFDAVLTVTDTGGNVASAPPIPIVVQTPPVTITAPLAGAVLDAGSNVVATGTGNNMRWRVDRTNDNLGTIATGTGASIEFVVPADSTTRQQMLIVLSGDGGTTFVLCPIRAAAMPLTAQATAKPTTGTVPLTVEFQGVATGGDGQKRFEWDFGDNSTPSNLQNPTHVYSQVQKFTAVLKITDAAGTSASSRVEIDVKAANNGGGFACDQIDVFWVASRRPYDCATLGTGGIPYTDEPYTMTAVPGELDNTAWIQTANADARRRRRWFMFFRTTAPVKVMVGFDAMARRLPRWLRGWTDEGQTITLDNGRVMNVYTRQYPAGWVVLGSNRDRLARWPRGVDRLNYVVGLAPGSAIP